MTRVSQIFTDGEKGSKEMKGFLWEGDASFGIRVIRVNHAACGTGRLDTNFTNFHEWENRDQIP